MVALETLEKLEFLEGFPPLYLKPLAEAATVIGAPAGEILFREGEKSPCIYVVMSGKVALDTWVTGDGATRFQTVGPGKLLGWSPILTQRPMTATAVALEPCQLLAINAMQVLEMLPRTHVSGWSSCGGQRLRCPGACTPRVSGCSTHAKRVCR